MIKIHQMNEIDKKKTRCDTIMNKRPRRCYKMNKMNKMT